VGQFVNVRYFVIYYACIIFIKSEHYINIVELLFDV